MPLGAWDSSSGFLRDMATVLRSVNRLPPRQQYLPQLLHPHNNGFSDRGNTLLSPCVCHCADRPGQMKGCVNVECCGFVIIQCRGL